MMKPVELTEAPEPNLTGPGCAQARRLQWDPYNTVGFIIDSLYFCRRPTAMEYYQNDEANR